SSKDVIHSFFVPDFRIKMDVLPNRYSLTWFNAKNVGVHNVFCTEYCGEGHSNMIGKIRVVSQEEYTSQQDQIDLGEGLSPVEYGTKLFNGKACSSCHSIAGKSLVGPHLNGIFGTPVLLEKGNEIVVDENYIRQSILDPKKDIVAGYQSVMPTYQGLLDDKQVDALVAYIKSLKGQE
ncbi:MAG: c-type cytochrome, partial [Candidatus Zixiibacteriota bacterium]